VFARSTRLLAEVVFVNHESQLRFRQRFQMHLDLLQIDSDTPVRF
jgi:hypothetical protein